MFLCTRRTFIDLWYPSETFHLCICSKYCVEKNWTIHWRIRTTLVDKLDDLKRWNKYFRLYIRILVISWLWNGKLHIISLVSRHDEKKIELDDWLNFTFMTFYLVYGLYFISLQTIMVFVLLWGFQCNHLCVIAQVRLCC